MKPWIREFLDIGRRWLIVSGIAVGAGIATGVLMLMGVPATPAQIVCCGVAIGIVLWFDVLLIWSKRKERL